MAQLIKKTHDLVTSSDSNVFTNICRLCGRYNWNMTSIFDVTNKYDYCKVINTHFRDFSVSKSDDLPLKICIHCVATLTAWHEYYNSCIDVNKRLKNMKLKAVVAETIQDSCTESDNHVHNSFTPDHNSVFHDDAASISELKPLDDIEITSEPKQFEDDEKDTLELNHLEDDVENTLELKQFEDENTQHDETHLTDDIEVIEIKMNDDNDEMETEDLYDDSSCTEDAFDDIANVPIQDDPPSLASSESISDASAEDKKLDSEEMAILHHDLNTVVNDTIQQNETRKTVEQPSSQKNEKLNKLKRSTVCRICGKLYVTRTSYLHHLLRQHSYHSSAKSARNTPAKSGAIGSTLDKQRPPRESSLFSADTADVKIKEESSRTMCDVCGKTFRFASSYRKHFRDFHSDGPPKPKPLRSRRMCDLCGKICSGGSFNGHMKKHTNPESVTCPHCGLLFSFESVLKSHIKVRHSNERPFQCELCDSNFKRADYLRSHMRYKHEPKLLRSEEKSSSLSTPSPFRCDECDASFKNQEALDKHLSHRNADSAMAGTPCERKCPSVFRCEECDTTFKKRNYLTLHKRYVHDKQQPFRISEASVGPYKCDRCERRFASVCGRNYHCKSVHGSLYDTKFSETCDHCGLLFKNRVFYAKHCAKLRDKPTCYLCWSAFDEEAALKQHMHDVHVDDLPFLCELCNRRFVTLRQLHDHIKSRHAKIRPFKCTYCTHTAVRKDSLEVHIRGCHLGQKPYKCDLCEKAFSQSSDLRKHRVTHTRNKLTQVKKKKILIEESTSFVAAIKLETN